MCLSSTLLPVPGGTQQRDGFPFLDREVDPVKHHLLAEPLPHIAQLDHQLSSTWRGCMSSSRITTELATTAPVVDRPTPSAPCLVLNPM